MANGHERPACAIVSLSFTSEGANAVFNLGIGNVEGRPFHDVAHSGAKIQYVIDNVPENIGNPQLVTLQIGERLLDREHEC